MNVNDLIDDVILGEYACVIRCLGWIQRKEARDVSSKDAIKLIADMGGDVMSALKELDTPGTDDAEATEDPLQGLDQQTVLHLGVVKITHRGIVKYPPEPGANEGRDFVYLDGLGEDDAEALAHAIVAFSGRTITEGKG